MGLFYTDIPELEGSNTEVSLSNLLRLEKKFEGLTEKISAHIDELAYAVVTDGGDFDIVKSILLSIRGDGTLDDSNIIDENRADIALLYSQTSLCERLILYRLTCEKFYEKYNTSLLSGLLEKRKKAPARSIDKIGYVKNTYNDEAYIKLSSGLQRARANYFEDTLGVCASIADGACEYCILPLEASGVKLSPFYELVLRYGFEIVTQCIIKTPDGYTKYALLHANNAIGVTRGDSEHAQLMLSPDEPLCELLIACEYCGGKICRTDHINGMTLITIDVGECDMETLGTYLILECPSIKILGIYNEIK